MTAMNATELRWPVIFLRPWGGGGGGEGKSTAIPFLPFSLESTYFKARHNLVTETSEIRAHISRHVHVSGKDKVRRGKREGKGEGNEEDSRFGCLIPRFNVRGSLGSSSLMER